MSHERLSTLANGDVVFALDARGDLRGLVTLTLHQNVDATVTGEWSLVAEYFEDIDENGNPVDTDTSDDTAAAEDPPAEHHDGSAPHVERIRFVNLGTIGGTVNAAELIRDADGTVTGVQHVLLTIVSSTLTFEGAVGGGSIEPSSLHESGMLNLVF